MDRIRNLETYQKVILSLLIVMLIAFTISYSIQSSQEGIIYREAFFRFSSNEEIACYSGILDGEQAEFRVTPDKLVYFTVGARSYGPYSVREDQTAVPENQKDNPYATGIEVHKGEEIIFRGIVHRTSDEDFTYILIDENGDIAGQNFYITANSGVITEIDGKVIDPFEPGVGIILKLMDGPPLAKRCQWIGWLLGVFCSVTLTISILFADELFRFKLSFHIRDAEYVEPSDWEIGRWVIGWILLFIMSIVSYSIGLR